ncbi:hypothetical protein PsYK624_113190 [Phanerochaete sordida]|uniref:Uncharacterized protein n=1 Tax=Phanerochaete sordida TaxID=48140 RepID=A0A9P3GHR7_9APHY|nr:hypothetical protein PsYK624_113190 [Phanerochaete sordida]
MSRPITLWHPIRSVTTDDSCTTVVKYSYKNTLATPAPYEAPHTAYTNNPAVYVPSLQSLCINILSEYPDQLHIFGSTRLLYHSPQTEGEYDLLREVIPAYRSDPPLSESELLRSVNPRLWATLIQLYGGLPDFLRTYKLPLADPQLPLLQTIPSTHDFALITVVELPGCRELTDDTVVQLGQLHALTALDVSATSLTSWGVKTLAKTLMKRTEPSSSATALSGPWGLRILFLHDCIHVDKEVLPCLQQFPLLSAIDLTGTRYTHTVDHDTPFRLDGDPGLYHPNSLFDALDALDEMSCVNQNTHIYAHTPPFRLHIDALEYKTAGPSRSASIMKARAKPMGFDMLTQLPVDDEQERVAAQEARREASKASAHAFYTAPAASKPPLTFAKFGEIYNMPSPRYTADRAKPSGARHPSRSDGQGLQRLFREPPPWSLLEQIRTEAFLSAQCTKPLSRAGTDGQPLSSPALVTSRRAKDSVGAVIDLLKGRGRPGHGKTQSVQSTPSQDDSGLNPFSRKRFEEAFNTSFDRNGPRATSSARKKRRVSLEDDVEGADEPVVPKSTLRMTGPPAKPATIPLTSLPIPPLPPGHRPGDGPHRAKGRPASGPGGAARPAGDTVQAKLHGYLQGDGARGRSTGAGLRGGMRGSGEDVAAVKIGEPSGSRAQGSSSGGKKKRKSTDSASSFDWKRWGGA